MFLSRKPNLAVLVAGVTLAAGQAVFNWTTITPSKELVWHSCMTRFECARLLVPYDWQDRSDERFMALAIQKLPAVVPEDDPTFGGSIFANPGGPGHSGTLMIQSAAKYLQQTVDKPGKKHYEIVSWDPRGIGNSVPKVECLHRPYDVSSYNLESRGYHALDMGRTSVAYALGIFQGMGLKCKWEMDHGLDILPYLGTVDVVDDLKHMVELVEIPRRGNITSNNTTDARLQFYGFSYGTVIGQMFASRYPGNVGRIAVDGVVDMEDYMATPGWLTSTANMDNCVDHFFDLCLKAKTKCALYKEGDKCASEIEARAESFIESLDNKPIGAVMSDGRRAVITGHDFRLLFGTIAYNPVPSYEIFDLTLASAMQGNYTLLLEELAQMGEYTPIDQECKAPTSMDNSLDTLAAIYCLDADDLTGKDLDYWTAYADKMASTSRWFGFSVAQIQFACSSWPVRPKNRFTGPFRSPPATAALARDRPAAPILFISTRLDPVSPLASARNMQRRHAGAGLLIQESSGHTAFNSAPSRCRDETIRDFFDQGIVPYGERVCKEDCGPWDAGCSVFTPGNRSVAGAGAVRRRDGSGDGRGRSDSGPLAFSPVRIL
ncbi:unnamed protein product [Clonostachys chloroleuca]|uniref:Peptidase S33 tripeptidyl aminopeptidase-like C-terminal domain-containing protein n=1 Tax=Clonostachys chloroleuca TaxID=1926264 RepID=A0AA35Q4H7_9HYPO|nr:unnamed protein product [Clonostachys chloroleuca]